ncbi:MAG TPA: hypothetical protein P5556_00750 [Candidatus Gastranaerophilales bacterium]|nr:hypothetical protein [Candidatus Gastranaerophilales bacterium]
MKHIVLYSNGAQSAYTAYFVAKKYGTKNLVLLYNPTGAEHPDSKRFASDISELIGVEITEISCGMDLWELIEKEKFIPNPRAAFCTRQLKVIPARKYFKTLKEDFRVYLGYTKDEKCRAERFLEANPDLNARFPMIEKDLSAEDAKKKLIRLGIKLPESYLYFEHNNCIPCVKGGKNYFKQVLKYFPKQYQKMAELEKRFGHTVLKNISLEELTKEVA